MNEVLFFFQICLVVGFVLGALRLGAAALTAWIVVQGIIANLFVLKQITLWGFEVTASDVFAIGSLLALNLLQEFFSKEEANRATQICFYIMLFFVSISQLHLLFEPSIHDFSQSAFLTILSPSPRLLFASMSVFFVVQQIDIRFFAFLKRYFPERSFSLRMAVSLVFSQFLDTILFTIIGLYGLVHSLLDIILISFLIKLIVISCSTPFMRWARIYTPSRNR